MNIKVVYRKLGKHRAMGRALEDERTIEIDTRLKGLELTDTLLHETLHLLVPEWTEEKVNETATILATVLHNELSIEKK